MTVNPIFKVELCNGCGLCVITCENGGWKMVDRVAEQVAGVECDWCTNCEAVCLTGAISCPFEIVLEE